MARGTKLEVGVLGATGMVGQQFMARLANHPWFDLAWLGASERSQGKAYATAAPWRLASPMPDRCRDMSVEACVPGQGPKILFSALDATAADALEAPYAAAGHIILSNARSHRMDPLVPLLIPEVNADHLGVLPDQRAKYHWPGAIVTNPNCAAIVLAMALAPLRLFEIRAVLVTTMQAVSGAGYPGVPSLDIIANIVPFIGGGEEQKIEAETVKILGADHGRAPYPAIISAQGEPRARHRRTHDDRIGGARHEALHRRCARGAAGVSRQASRIEAAHRARSADRPDGGHQSPTAASRRRSRRRYGRFRWPRARLSSAVDQIRGARPQHYPRRRRRISA